MKNKLLVLFLLFYPTYLFAEPFKIGLMNDLSGQYLVNGEDCNKGFELAKAEYSPDNTVADYQIEFVFEDSQSSPPKAVNAFQKLVKIDKVKTVAFMTSRVAMAVNPISKNFQIPIVGIAANAKFTKENPYAFGAWWDAAYEGETIAEQLIKNDFKKAAIISLEDEYTISFLEYFQDKYKSLGGELLYDQTVAANDVDFSSIISKIKTLPVEAIVVNLASGSTGNFLKKLQEQNLKKAVFGSFFISRKTEHDIAGKEAVEGAMFVLPKLNWRFISKFKNMYPDTEPHALHYGCFAGLAFILQTLSRNQSIQSPQELWKKMNSSQSFELLDQEVFIREQKFQYQPELKIIKSGKIEAFVPRN